MFGTKSKALRRTTAIGALIAGAAAIASPAAAQNQPSAQDQPSAAAESQAEEEIVVTGSRLRRESFETAHPAVQVGGEEMESAQISNAIDALEDLPLIGIGVNNRGTQVQNGDSFAFPDVLDLGTQRTLTLLNGRRVVAGNQGTVFVPGNASGAQVDLSMINPQIIERVEVVAGTGGAVYGADAVGGVVNIITKEDFDGLDLRVQGGVTEFGDGEQYRASGLWGTNFHEDRGNIAISAEYFHQDIIVSGDESAQRYYLPNPLTVPNRFDGSTRNTASFDAQAAVATLLGGGTLNPAFFPAASDGISNTFFGPIGLANPLISEGGVFLTGQGPISAPFGTTTDFFPATPVTGALANRAADPQLLAFWAPSSLPAGTTADAVINTLAPGTVTTGLTGPQMTTLALALLQRNRPTPFEYLSSHSGLDPMLFIGSFGAIGATTPAGFQGVPNGGFPVVPNTDPATQALFPFRAVPMQFDASGNLVAYDIGDHAPPSMGRLGTAFGSGAYDPFLLGHGQIQAGTERFSFAALGNYEITDYLRYKSEILYSRAVFDQIGGAATNASSGNAQAGSFAVPVYIDQNPFVTQQARDTITTLQGQGLRLPTVPGQGSARVLYMGRALTDLFGGGTRSELEATTYRIAQILEGDFKLAGGDYYWELAAGYGSAEADTVNPDVRDVEFALATDVVVGPGGGPVCRQQTLTQPEPITVRNPGTASVLNAQGLTPTQAQVDACVPLNLFGSGAPSQAAIDYVMGNSSRRNLNTQEFYSGSLGGEIFRTPAGPLSLGGQIEWRRESAEFEPSQDLSLGLGRTALQGRGAGELTFLEYGYEANVPLFSEDFNFPLMRLLELNYAFRVVKRDQQSETALSQGEGTKDDTFNYGFRWQPVEDVTLRGARSRTVRSASLVELVGPFTIAFTALNAANTHPCATVAIGQGPNPAVRRANCIAAVRALGIADDDAGAAAFLTTFGHTAGTRSAVASGNPFLQNEQGDTYTYGLTYEPSWVPNLVLAADFFSVDLTNEVGLVGPMFNTCFDSTTYPNVPVGGVNACDTFLFGVPGSTPGTFVNPGAINPLTGNPSFSGVLGGGPAFTNADFQISLAQFNNLNLGRREFRGVNLEARYNFDLEDLPLIGSALANWGEIFLRGSYFQTQRFDVFGDSVNLTDRLAAEHTNPEFETRLDIRHQVGPFDHTLQWFWVSETVTNIQTPKDLYPEQPPFFIAEAYHFFNYRASYDVNDNFTVRLVINNLTDTDEPRGRFGFANQFDGGVGREYIIGLNARF